MQANATPRNPTVALARPPPIAHPTPAQEATAATATAGASAAPDVTAMATVMFAVRITT